MGILLIWVVVWGLIAAVVAQQKSGETVGGFFMGALLGPIGVVIAAIYKGDSKNIQKQQERQGMKKCQFCAEMIQGEAVVCRYCGRDIVSA